jgi:hypothetical protein
MLEGNSAAGCLTNKFREKISFWCKHSAGAFVLCNCFYLSCWFRSLYFMQFTVRVISLLTTRSQLLVNLLPIAANNELNFKKYLKANFS